MVFISIKMIFFEKFFFELRFSKDFPVFFPCSKNDKNKIFSTTKMHFFILKILTF